MARTGAPRGRPPKYDWPKIRSDYETGTFSIPMLTEKYGASRQAICKQIGMEGWSVGSTSKAVARRTREKMVFTEPGQAREDAIEVAATANAKIIREHQNVAGRGRALALRLLGELEETMDGLPTLEELVDLAMKDEAKMRAGLMAKLGTGSRAVTLRDIATAARTWVDVERIAFNLDGEKEDDPERWSDERLDARITELVRKARTAQAS